MNTLANHGYIPRKFVAILVTLNGLTMSIVASRRSNKSLPPLKKGWPSMSTRQGVRLQLDWYDLRLLLSRAHPKHS